MPKRRKPVYMGNKATGEFHSVKRQRPDCNVKLITPANRVEFRRGRDAVQAKFDACAHCVKHWKSRDNT